MSNLTGTNGLVFSQAVLLELVEAGMTRDQAYRTIQRNAMRSWEEGLNLLELLKKDPDMILDSETLTNCFSSERFLRNAGIVFDRLDHLELSFT